MSRDALIVGINRYQYLPDLKAPALDAEAIAQRLEADGGFGTLFRCPEAIQQVEDKKVAIVSKSNTISETQLRLAITDLFLNHSEQAPKTVLFYFSGHGIPDHDGFDKGYLAASDTNPNSPTSRLSLRWLQWVLSQSPIEQQIVWLDCCHSGSLLVNVQDANPGHGENKDRCFMASSRDFEKSWEDINSDYSVFTKAILDGLASPRPIGRGINTIELAEYVTQTLKGEPQTPLCTNFGKPIELKKGKVQYENSKFKIEIENSICPYKGLEFFDCNDEDPKYFFGRDQLVGQLLDQVRTSNFLALVGASGNGKSSVLRAGLLYQLKLGRRISGSNQWRIRITRPDRKPMENLALAFIEERLSDLDRAESLGKASGVLTEGAAGLRRLVQASIAPRTVLVIDQFEEVFTRCENTEERELFFDCLMRALSDTDDKLCLIIAMRSDFIVKCHEQEYSGLARLIDQQLVSVLPMKTDELRAAICRPAEQVNLQVEPSLITEILNDIAEAPGSLPLLQYTLKELWNQRHDNQLTLATYQKLGGIQGTLDQRATAIYNSFDEAEQQTVQHIFQQLTQLGEGTEDTRRRVFQDDLVAEPKHPTQRVQQVIEQLSSPENRLIVTSEVVSKSDQSSRMSIVDVAHEALIRHWKLLRQWIEQNRDLLRKQRKIEASAIAWRNQNRKLGYLLQGLPLIEAIQFNKNEAKSFPLSDNGKSFILKSLRQRHLNRLKTGAWLIVPALILLVVVEHNIRESAVKRDYARLDQEGTYEEKQAIEDLVKGCKGRKENTWLPNYLIERMFGNCRLVLEAPLKKAKLSSASLSSANLSNANLSNANLSSADLSSAYLNSAYLNSANLSSANLSSADLSSADLSSADLSSADLSSAYLNSANLSSADLSSADLRSTNLTSAYLGEANLYDVNLSFANLNSVSLMGTNLSKANLSKANLREANLREANLREANLREANLREANLREANLSLSDIRSTNLSNADLSGGDFNSANLSKANLSKANLSFANLSFANLSFANLSSTDLRKADLRKADLIRAHFSNANLSSANLSNANLSSTDLRNAYLEGANLNSAILLSTDLRYASLTQTQLKGKEHPLICNSPLPQNIKIDLNRDCDKIATALNKIFPHNFSRLEQAKKYVEEHRRKRWGRFSDSSLFKFLPNNPENTPVTSP